MNSKENGIECSFSRLKGIWIRLKLKNCSEAEFSEEENKNFQRKRNKCKLKK
jgi:hypothetical protein